MYIYKYKTMIALCASHINSNLRFSYFQYMILSWSKQTHPCKLYISISFDYIYQVSVINFIQKEYTANNYKNLIFFIRDSKKTQFEHYEALLAENKETMCNEWIIFTDDDAIWHNTRVESYHSAIKHYMLESTTNKAICLPYTSSNDLYDNIELTDLSLSLSPTGLKELKELKELKGLNGLKRLNTINYFTIAATYKTIMDHIKYTKDATCIETSDPVFATAFTTTFQNINTITIPRLSSKQWLYIHRKYFKNQCN